MKTEPTILLVEDDEDDLFLARRILNKAGLTRIFHVGDGHAAIDYLSGRGNFSDRKTSPLPDIMLVDLKIPKINGHQVVEWVAQQPQLKNIRVFILSSSGEERDRDRARAGGALGYFVKPLVLGNVPQLLGTEAKV